MNNVRKIALVVATVAMLVSFARLTRAQEKGLVLPFKVTKVKDNVYWAVGHPNNGIIVGTTGVIVVDTEPTPDAEKKLIAEISKITPKAVNTAILTHSDPDHVDGLAAFPAGLTIIAQENCKKEMEESVNAPDPAPQDRLPTKTYDKTDDLTIDGVHVRLYHWAPGHTSGDTVVYLPEHKVVFGGDLLTSDRPDVRIHEQKGGSVPGWIENAKGILGLNADTFLTGHGHMMTRSDVQEKLEFIQDKYNWIKAMVAQGKSLDEIKASFGEPAVDRPSKPGTPPPGHLTEVIYRELTMKKKS